VGHPGVFLSENQANKTFASNQKVSALSAMDVIACLGRSSDFYFCIFFPWPLADEQ